MSDAFATTWVNAQLRDKIIACGGTPVVTDMLAVNAYNLLLAQLLGLLCCGSCAGGGAYSHVEISPGETANVSTYAWGPPVNGVAGYALGAFDASQPGLLISGSAEPFQLQLAPGPGGLIATSDTAAPAQAVNGGWIDSTSLVVVGGVVYAHQIVTNGLSSGAETLVPYVITGAESGILVGQLQIYPSAPN